MTTDTNSNTLSRLEGIRADVLYRGSLDIIVPGRAVYAFDLDNTLITRDIRRDHASSTVFPHVVGRLRELVAGSHGDAGGEIVIFSNQHGMNSLGIRALVGAID